MNYMLSINKFCSQNTKDLVSGFIKRNIKSITFGNPKILNSTILFYFNNEYFNPEQKIKYIPKVNKTWIVRKNSNKDDESNEYLFHYFDNLAPIINDNHCLSGDQIKIYDGIYDNIDGLWFSDLNVHIIGIGEVVLNNFNPDISRSNVLIENVTIHCGPKGGMSAAIELVDSNLWLTECKIDFEETAICTSNNLYITNCSFFGRTDNAESAICISPWAENIFILKSTFSSCGGGCYATQNGRGEYSCIEVSNFDFERNNKHPTTKMVCIGNKFVDNYGYLVAKQKVVNCYADIREEEEENAWFDKFEQNKHCALQCNTVQGFNGLYVEERVNDPNILYNQILDDDS